MSREMMSRLWSHPAVPYSLKALHFVPRSIGPAKPCHAGNVFVLMLGHAARSFQTTALQQIVRNGVDGATASISRQAQGGKMRHVAWHRPRQSLLAASQRLAPG